LTFGGVTQEAPVLRRGTDLELDDLRFFIANYRWPFPIGSSPFVTVTAFALDAPVVPEPSALVMAAIAILALPIRPRSRFREYWCRRTFPGPSVRDLLFALRSLLLAASILAGTSTVSAEMLLAEISYTAPEPVVAPASFNFGVGNHFIGPPTFHNWTEIVPAFPYTSSADPATVGAFDRLLTTFVHEDGIAFGLTNGPYLPPRPGPFATFSLHRAFEGDYAGVGLTATQYAPAIGESHAFQWYTVTALERSAAATVQTIRIYGFAVPEPATWLLAVLGGLLHLNMCHSCPGRGHLRRRCHKR
jgi:hypothetical protein